MKLEYLPLFSELSSNDIRELEKFSTIKQLNKDEIVFYQEDESTYLHILAQGNAKIYRLDSKDHEIILHNFTAPILLAERANLLAIPYPANCVMTSDGVIVKVDFRKFKEFMNKGDVCFKIMQSLLKKMTLLEEAINNNVILDAKTKIAKFIYNNPEAFESLKQHTIAELLNIKRETLSRKLKSLKELGIIETINAKNKVVNKEKIKELFTW